MMKQKIYDIPIWEAYGLENCECALCIIEKNMEISFMDILFDDMLMTPYFAKKLQSYRFCSNHFRKLYIYKDKLGLALIVNNFLQCEKETLEQGVSQASNRDSKGITIKKMFSGKKATAKQENEMNCYLCEQINNNIIDYVEVLVKLWDKNTEFKKLFASSRGHCMKHYNLVMDRVSNYLHGSSLNEFKEITHKIQLENVNRIIGELDWFATKFDYRFKEAPWKNSKDALPRSINKLIGDYYEEK
jgi:hypothetical protein